MKISLKNLLLLVLMLTAAAIAVAMKPTEIMAKSRGKLNLETLVPASFGTWKQLEQSGQVINPQQTELLKTIYSQTLSRTYVNAQGVGIMLSIAYGENQSDGLSLHIPDVCYPAQGFRVNSNVKGNLATPLGTILVSRLETELGKRKEPLTYWTTIGNKVVQGGTARKLEQMQYGFKGQIPDGLIFRVSNITGDSKLAYELQQQFVSDLLTVLTPEQRQFISGI
jgi:EpsI family protein